MRIKRKYKNYPGPGIKVTAIDLDIWIDRGWQPTQETELLKGWPDRYVRKYTAPDNGKRKYGIGDIWIGGNNEKTK